MVLPETVIIQLATLSEQDRYIIHKCRGERNRLGFSYQLMFVKVFNRFPRQFPLEVHPQILTFAVLQMGVNPDLIQACQKRQQTISQHQQHIRDYLNLTSFDDIATAKVKAF